MQSTPPTNELIRPFSGFQGVPGKCLIIRTLGFMLFFSAGLVLESGPLATASLLTCQQNLLYPPGYMRGCKQRTYGGEIDHRRVIQKVVRFGSPLDASHQSRNQRPMHGIMQKSSYEGI